MALTLDASAAVRVVMDAARQPAAIARLRTTLTTGARATIYSRHVGWQGQGEGTRKAVGGFIVVAQGIGELVARRH